MLRHAIPTLLVLWLVLSQAGSAVAVGQPGGVLVVVNKSGDSVSLLDPESGRSMAEVPTGEGPHEVSVSPDGRYALVSNYGSASQSGNSLTVIDLRHARASSTISLGQARRPHGVAWMPDGRHAVVTVEKNRALLVVAVDDSRIVREIPTGQDLSHMVALAPDSGRAWVTSIQDGTVAVIDPDKGELLATVKTGAGAEGVAVSPDGRRVWVTNRAADTVTVIDAASFEVVATLDAPGFPIRVVLSTDGRRALVSKARSSSVDVFDAGTFRRVAEISMRGEFSLTHGRWLGGGFGWNTQPIGILIHPDGRRAWVSNAYGGFVAVLDLETNRITGSLIAGKEPDGLGFSREGILSGDGKSN